ncbi:MAG TPA: type IV pilus secretin PilQ [Candidatus Binatia bacterium]|nr:type IV pilus secretin PilQ [Candidatus Binatia bacterium]
MAKNWHHFFDTITSGKPSTLPLFALLFTVLGLSAFGCAVQNDPQVTSQSAQQAARPAASPAPAITVTPMQRIQDLAVREERGQTILLIKFSQPLSNYRHFPLPNPARIVLDIFGDAKQPGPSETYRIDTSAVATLRVNQLEGGLRLTTDIAAATVPTYSITQDNGGLRIVIGADNPSATAKKDVTVVSGGVRADIRSQDSAKAPGRASGAEKGIGDKKEYTGQKISLEFKDADIKNVFRLLGEVSGKNIVVTDDVNRRVTLRLIEVPWDQAMDLIIDTNGLGKDENGNIIRISTAGRLKAERDALAAAKKSEENLEDLQTAYLTLNYAKVVKGPTDTNTDKDLVDKAKALLSPRGRIEADQRSNTLIIRDIKSGIEDVQRLISRLDTRTPQVLIESNLIETTPTFSRSLGMQMETLFNNGRVRSSTRFQAIEPYTGASLTFPESATPVFSPASGFNFAYIGNNVAAMLSAAEAEGNVKIISRPSVVTLNNVESQIQSANIIRVRTTAATVGEAGSLREIQAGITLRVTPQVSADGFVLLNIYAKSSTLDFGRTVDGIPQENTREAKANVLVRDGETVVIGGIMKDTSSDSETGVPYLKDVPVLGWLFKRLSVRKDMEELVVFITPRVIASGSENLPTADQIWREQMQQTDGKVPPVTSLNP